MSATIDEVLVVGRTYRFPLAATETNRTTGIVTALNLTGATVTLLLNKPDGSTLTRTATIDNATLGLAHYDTLGAAHSGGADLDQGINWSLCWIVQFPGDTPPKYLPSNPIVFRVQATRA